MKVKVLNEDGTSYSSLLFGIHYDEWKTEAFVMTPTHELKRVFEYDQGTEHICKIVFFVDGLCANEEWEEIDDYDGYGWFIKEKGILDKIRKNEPVDESIRNRCEQMNAKYLSEPESYVVEDVQTCENLLNMTGFFHDALVTGFEWNEDKTKLTVSLDGVWGFKKFYLDFEGNIEATLEENYEYFYFCGASLFMDDGQVCFVDEEGYTNKEEVEKAYTHVFADKLSYRFEFEVPEHKKKRENDADVLDR